MATPSPELTPKDQERIGYATRRAQEAIMASTEMRPYIVQAQLDVTKFAPHEWVQAAINAAYEEGKRVNADEHQFLVQQMEEQHQLDQNNIMRAAVAAVLEAAPWIIETNDSISVTVNMEAQRTIWDRATLTSSMLAGGKSVAWTLTSHKALPKAE